MRPIIIDYTDLSDSKEVYESKPNKVIPIMIFTLFIVVIIAFIWMAVSPMDIVVKSSGVFKSTENATDVSNQVAGEIISINVENGDYVQKGDTLYQLKINESDLETIEEIKDRIEILKAYQNYLNNGSNEIDNMTDNQYYDEFYNRKELLSKSIQADSINIDGQNQIYQTSISTTEESIANYKQKIADLTEVKNCVIKRANSFNAEKSYYKSIVESYIANYNLTASQYDTKIKTYETQLEETNKNNKEIEERNSKKTAALNQKDNSEDEESNQDGESTNEVQNQEDYELESLTDTSSISQEIESLKNEKVQTLANLELQQLTTIESQIETLNQTIETLENNISSAESQLNANSSKTNSSTRDVKTLTEQGNVAAELLEYESKAKSYDEYVANYDEESGSYQIKAKTDGYYYMTTSALVGDYIQAGNSIGSIYPNEEGGYYADIYVSNSDIGKVEEGQKVNFEIAAYPSSDYGYFKGTIEHVSKDITVDENSGSAYYIVKVKCDSYSVTNKKGETGTLQNGMACSSKIVIGKESVLHLLLRQMDFVD